MTIQTHEQYFDTVSAEARLRLEQIQKKFRRSSLPRFRALDIACRP